MVSLGLHPSSRVSALKDEGLPTETNVVSVTVNGLGTMLGEVDGNGNRSFETTNAVPMPADGSALTLTAVIDWADDSQDPTSCEEGYYILSKFSSYKYSSSSVDGWDNCPCVYGPSTSKYSIQDEFSLGSATTTEGGQDMEWDCDGSVFYTNDWTWTTNSTPDQPSSQFRFGNLVRHSVIDDFRECGPGMGHVEQEWDGWLEFKVPDAYPPGTWVVFTISAGYGVASGQPDLGQVTLWGKAPFAPGQYLIQVTGGQTLSLDSSSFGWPGQYSRTWTNTLEAPPLYAVSTGIESGNWFAFSEFHSDAVNISVSPNPFTFCVGTNTHAFTASGAPGTFTYSWDSSGEIVSTSGSRNENALIKFTTAGNASVTATAGVPSGMATGIVVIVEISPGDGWNTSPGCTNVFTASGHPAGGTYSWSCGEGTSNSTICVFGPGSAGTNVVTVTYSLGDANCSASSTGLVDVAAGPWQFIDPPDCTGGFGSWQMFTKPDQCGNTLDLWCEGTDYVLRYNGGEVGRCWYGCGVNVFAYRMTSNGKRFHSTWHLTRRCPRSLDPSCPANPLCWWEDFDWTLWKYDCINLVPSSRQGTTNAWNNAWWDPDLSPDGPP